MIDWIVAHCHAHSESKAEAHLKRQGFDIYLPKFKTTRRHARRIETVIRPLFPRYIFVGIIEGSTHWRPIRSTVGVSHLITAGERPLVVPSWVIDQLREREDANGLFSGIAETSLIKGEAIQIISGPLAEHRGIFDGLNDSQRVAVLLDIMGRQVKTLVPLEAIRRAS